MNRKDHERLILRVHSDYGEIIKAKDARIADLEDEVLGLTQSNNELRWRLNNPPPKTLDEIDVGIDAYMRQALQQHNDSIAETMGVAEGEQRGTDSQIDAIVRKYGEFS